MRKKNDAGPVLDFIVIGAQKAGTTALHRYLSPHPAIFLPPEKELPFFCGHRSGAVGWPTFFDRYYSKAPLDSIIGKVTPHYMMDVRVPSRIASVMPKTKLIAILRHPVERAFSHYKHLVRIGLEDRPFKDAVFPLLRHNGVEDLRNLSFGLEHQKMQYLVLGEYGRIIKSYYDYFPEEQIMVIFSGELRKDRLRVLRTLFEFLCVDHEFVPDTTSREYNVGGEKALISRDTINKLKRNPLLRSAWSFSPDRLKKSLKQLLIYHNIKKDNIDPRLLLGQAAWGELCDYFRADILILEGLIGKKVPWNEFKNNEQECRGICQ